jgi:hypothetical protein
VTPFEFFTERSKFAGQLEGVLLVGYDNDRDRWGERKFRWSRVSWGRLTALQAK